MKKLITFALIALFAATAGAATQTLAQKHAKAGVKGNPTQEQCIACHGGSYEALAKQTSNVKPNPHGSHMGPVQCDACHSWKGRSNLMCSDCHSFRNFSRSSARSRRSFNKEKISPI